MCPTQPAKKPKDVLVVDATCEKKRLRWSAKQNNGYVCKYKIELFVGRYEMPNNMHFTITQYEGNNEWTFRNTTTFQFFRANQTQPTPENEAL